MTRIATRLAIAAACVAAAAFVAAPATAQKKMTKEEAWHECLSQVLKYDSMTPEASAERVATFKACMSKMGFQP